jgi:hypothetical protein
MWPVLEMQLTVDDRVEFQRYCFGNHPMSRNAVTKQRALGILAVVVGVSIGAQFFGDGALWSVGWGVPIILLMVVLATVMWFGAPKMLLETYERRLNLAVPNGYPPNRLWLDEWGISDQSAVRFTGYPWSTVWQVVETPTHGFIWTSRSTALIVPKRVGEPYFRAFIDTVKTCSAQAQYARVAGDDVSGR